MRCANCGAGLPDEANYCPRCGHPQQPEPAGAAPWETCEIVYARTVEVLITCHFWARAIGSHGEYSAGESAAWLASYPDSERSEALLAHYDLVNELVAAGWQHVGCGFFWYNDRFSRPAADHR